MARWRSGSWSTALRTADACSRRQPRRLVLARVHDDRRLRERVGCRASGRQARQAGVDGNAIEPGGKRRVSLEARQSPPRLQEGVLHRVAGLAVITQEPGADMIDRPLVPHDQDIERVANAAGCPAAKAGMSRPSRPAAMAPGSSGRTTVRRHSGWRWAVHKWEVSRLTGIVADRPARAGTSASIG